MTSSKAGRGRKTEDIGGRKYVLVKAVVHSVTETQS